MSRNKEAFGLLVSATLEAKGWAAHELAEHANTSSRTAEYWKSGVSSPDPAKRAEVEDALGWKRGSVSKVLASPDGTAWDLGDVQDQDAGWEPNSWVVEEARDLTTDQLMRELTYRVTLLQGKVDLYEKPSNVIRAEVSGEGTPGPASWPGEATVHELPKRKHPESQAARTKLDAEDPKNDTE